MERTALLIDYKFCSGCHSCELACRNALNLDLNEWGIKVLEDGPRQNKDGSWHWDYIPLISEFCDGCRIRVAKGELPSCVQHCQAHCMEYGAASEMAGEASRINRKVAVFLI